jgi:radical SAM superfamily enzyme YgiQ (UPF0313 family)
MHDFYEGTVYRPPSEAQSTILQVTTGCSHNRCTFCSMYKGKDFRVKSLPKLMEEIHTLHHYFPLTRRVFLADGNAMALSTIKLMTVLGQLKATFKALERISAYCAPMDVLQKSDEELKQIRKGGLSLVYLGIETGSDQLLTSIQKGVTATEMMDATIRLKKAGFVLSTTVISGLGGQGLWEEHARETAALLNRIQPDYIGLLTLMLERDTPLYEAYKRGEFKLLTPTMIIDETLLLIQSLELKNSVLRSNHASNYLPLKGHLPRDKEALLEQILNVKEDLSLLRCEELRQL